MTVDFTVFHIPRRMDELGYSERDYYTRCKHLIIKPDEQREVEAFNQLLFLVEETPDVKISSELGVYDLSSESIDEMQYEHQGQILINNQTASVRHVRFIQVIFKTNTQCQAQNQHTTVQK